MSRKPQPQTPAGSTRETLANPFHVVPLPALPVQSTDEYSLIAPPEGWVYVTPPLAQAMLDSLDRAVQRPLNRDQVRLYAQDMAAGKWRRVGSIDITPENHLVNGQHRLSAIVFAGQLDVNFTGVWLLVNTKADADSFEVIDTGLARSAATMFHLQGIKDSNAWSALVNKTMYYYLGGSKSATTWNVRTGPKFSWDQKQKWIADNPGLYYSHDHWARHAYSQHTNVPRALLATFHFVLSQNAPIEAADAFLEQVCTWNNIPDPHIARTAVNKLRAVKGVHEDELKFAILNAAWNKWALNEHPTNLIVPGYSRANNPRGHTYKPLVWETGVKAS